MGEVIHQIPNAGYVLVFLQQPGGVLGVLASIVALMLSWSLFFGKPPEPFDRQARRGLSTPHHQASADPAGGLRGSHFRFGGAGSADAEGDDVAAHGDHDRRTDRRGVHRQPPIRRDETRDHLPGEEDRRDDGNGDRGRGDTV